MSFWTSIPGIIIAVAGVLAILAVATAYFLSILRKNNRQETKEVKETADETTNFWKERLQDYKDIVNELTAKLESQKDDFNKQMREMGRELGEVRGQLTEKEKQSKIYLDILQNRDPEMKKFMEIMLKFAEDQMETNKKTSEVLASIHTMAEAEHNRDFKVEATVTKSE